MSSTGEDAKHKDGWLSLPYLCLVPYPVITFAQAVFDRNLEYLLTLALMLSVVIALLVVMPFVAVKSFKQKRRRRAISAMLLPVFGCLLMVSTPFLSELGDTVYFYRDRDSLQQEVDKAGGKDSEKLLVWVTGGFLDAANGFVYDGSDEVALPIGLQSVAWKKRAHMTELEDMCFDASQITGHYYRFSTIHGC